MKSETLHSKSEIARQQVVAKTQPKTKIKVVNFDAVRLRAPFILRCAALLIDYLLVMTAPVAAIVFARWSGVPAAKLLNNQMNTIGWLIALLIGITNFIILPAVLGWTVGKAAVGLRVVAKDGGDLTFTSALVRHLVGYPLTIITAGFGFLLAAFNPHGKALHDYLAGTIVVQARRVSNRQE